jgi:mono/diheme cytochrome c family protein
MKPMSVLPVLPLLGALAFSAGAAPANSLKITKEDRAEAQQMFNTRCAACHGTSGKGDGPGSASLNPKPRNFHDEAWQKTVKDDEIEQAIMYGGAAVNKSPAMPANPDLASNPELVGALRELVRGFVKAK